MVKQRSNFITSHKILTVSVSILLLLAVAIAGRMIYERSVVNEMRAIANQVQADPSWTLTSEHHIAPLLVCIADESCPHYVKSWSTPTVMSESTLDQIITNAHLDNARPNICLAVKGSEALNACEKTISYKGYLVSIRYSKESAKNTKGTLQIDIRR